MTDNHLDEATETIKAFARKLDAVYQTSGREGLREYNASEIAVLYWCKQHEEGRLAAKIEAGEGRELDVRVKERLAEELEELHEYLWERAGEIER